MGCLATVLGAVEEGNTANRGGCIQHVSGCVSSARLSHRALYSNESHLLGWKISKFFEWECKKKSNEINMHSLTRRSFHTVIWCDSMADCTFVGIILHSILHHRPPLYVLFHHPATCLFSCIRSYICMNVNRLPASTFDSDTLNMSRFVLMASMQRWHKSCVVPGAGFILWGECSI